MSKTQQIKAFIIVMEILFYMLYRLFGIGRFENRLYCKYIGFLTTLGWDARPEVAELSEMGYDQEPQ